MASSKSRQEPRSSMSRQEPRSSMSRQEPRSSMSRQEPRSSMSHQEPRSSMSRQEPRSSMSHQEPRSSMSRQEPRSSMSRQEPRSSMSCQEPRSASSSKSVSFSETANVYYFKRQPSFDRWPRDGKTYGLGMQATHFYQNQQPVTEGTTGHRPVPYNDCSKRKALLCLDRLSAEDRQTLRSRKKKLKRLYVTGKRSGCSCLGVCLPETCECILAAIECCQAVARSQVRCCCERIYCPTTKGLPSYALMLLSKKMSRRKKLASLSSEDSSGSHSSPSE